MHDFLAERILKEVHEQVELLRAILRKLKQHDVTGGTVRLIQGEDTMPLVPGGTANFAVTLDPANATYIPADATWSTNDPANFPIAASTDGLSAVVTAAPGVAVGTQYTVTWAYSNADGTTATADIVETVTAPVIDVTGGTLTETA